MTREQIERAIKCCNPYDENCGDCPFKDLPLGRCFEVLAKTAFNMLLEDRARLQKQVDEYKAKIEQGTLIELPCKVGDTVYTFGEDSIEEHEVLGVLIQDEFYLKLFNKSNFVCKIHGYKTVFLAREEAEKRLKELQNG